MVEGDKKDMKFLELEEKMRLIGMIGKGGFVYGIECKFFLCLGSCSQFQIYWKRLVGLVCFWCGKIIFQWTGCLFIFAR